MPWPKPNRWEAGVRTEADEGGQMSGREGETSSLAPPPLASRTALEGGFRGVRGLRPVE